MSPVIVFIGGMRDLLFSLFLLMTIDLITDVRKVYYKKKKKIQANNKKAKKRKKKNEFWIIIKSVKCHLLRSTWRKSYECILGITVIAIFEVSILGKMEIELLGMKKLLTEWAIVMISSIEIWSIFENLEAVSGNNPLKRLSGILPEKMKKMFERNEKH